MYTSTYVLCMVIQVVTYALVSSSLARYHSGQYWAIYAPDVAYIPKAEQYSVTAFERMALVGLPFVPSDHFSTLDDARKAVVHARDMAVMQSICENVVEH